MLDRLMMIAFVLLVAATPARSAEQSPPKPEMPPGAGIAAIWSQIMGLPAGAQPAGSFAPPSVELRFILAGDQRSCAEYSLWYRESAKGAWTQSQASASERDHAIGGFDVSTVDFPMTLCRLQMPPDWYEAGVSELGARFSPVTVWSPNGKTVKGIVAGGASVGRRNDRVDQIVMVTLGDTGCRGTPIGAGGRNSQDCSRDWAFPELMDKASKVRLDDGSLATPDLFLHMGDYRYFWEDYQIDPSKSRSPDNEGHSDDNLGYWLQEFLTPAQEALTVAPWALSRGNHETCPDVKQHWYGKGWFYLFGDVDWPAQPCVNLVPTTYFDVGPDGGRDPKSRHRVVMVDNSDPARPAGATNRGRSLTDLLKDAVRMTGNINLAYVSSTHWASHIPGLTYLAYCKGQCGGENADVLKDVQDAFGNWVPCQDRGPGVPSCVPSTLFRGHQHFYQRIRLSDVKSAKRVDITWTWPQTYIVGHGGTSADNASISPNWCWTGIDIPNSPGGKRYKANVVADSRHGFVVWRRAADTLSNPAGWAEAPYWQNGSDIRPPDKGNLSECTLK